MNPILNYAAPTRPTTTNWPWPILLIVGTVGIVLAPSVACACWKGEYKAEFVALICALLIPRTLIALLLRENSYAWIWYLLAAIASFFIAPPLLETLL